MKRAYLFSLFYIPFAICAVIPNKAPEKVDNEKAQLIIDQAQDAVVDAITEQLKLMDIPKVMNDVFGYLQQSLQGVNLEEYVLNSQALQEYAGRDLLGEDDSNKGNPKLSGNSPGNNGSKKSFQLPNLLGNSGKDSGMFHFGDGSPLENLLGLLGSIIGGILDPIGKIFTGGFKKHEMDKIGDMVHAFFKGIGDKIKSSLPEPSKLEHLLIPPPIDGTTSLFKGFDKSPFNFIPKIGVLGANHLPGFRRYQTHEFLVEDLSNLKNIFLEAMREQSPIAADGFDSLFDKFNQVFEYASSVDPSMNDALIDPTEDNIRYALMSLFHVFSVLGTQ